MFPRRQPYSRFQQSICIQVAIDATKAEIKSLSNSFSKVKVNEVNTLRVKGKVKRNKFGFSTKSTWKKAYVRLEQGQDIDFAVAD